MKNIIVGDTVKIIRDGLIYPTYTEWAMRNGATNWKSDREPEDIHALFKVITMAEHSPNNIHSKTMLYLIEKIAKENNLY